MSPLGTLPDADEIAELFTDTLAKGVKAKRVGVSRAVGAQVTAIYRDSAGEASCVCLCDLKLAACLGAAFMLIPAQSALNDAAKGLLSEGVLDTLGEVLNIAAQLFRPENASFRIVFGEMYLPQQKLPDGFRKRLRKPAERMDFHVTIAGYTNGRMSMMILDPATA